MKINFFLRTDKSSLKKEKRKSFQHTQRKNKKERKKGRVSVSVRVSACVLREHNPSPPFEIK